MVDYQNTVLTKTEMSEKLFGDSKSNFHRLLITGCFKPQTKENYNHFLKWLILKLLALNVNFWDESDECQEKQFGLTTVWTSPFFTVNNFVHVLHSLHV